jgi:hypothetical protein
MAELSSLHRAAELLWSITSSDQKNINSIERTSSISRAREWFVSSETDQAPGGGRGWLSRRSGGFGEDLQEEEVREHARRGDASKTRRKLIRQRLLIGARPVGAWQTRETVVRLKISSRHDDQGWRRHETGVTERRQSEREMTCPS